MVERYSHPPENGHDGVHLLDHLTDVATRVGLIIPTSTRTVHDEPLQEIVETLALVHDFGKATTYFQQHLGVLSGEPEYPALKQECQNHSPIGSYAAFYALRARGYTTETCLAGFVAVAKHHGQVPDLHSYVYERAHRRENVPDSEQNDAERQQTAIALQIEDIRGHVDSLAADVFERATAGQGSWEEFSANYDEILDEVESTVSTAGGGLSREVLSESCYALVLECWGPLVLADKTSAASAKGEFSVTRETYAPLRAPRNQLEKYVRNLEVNSSANPDGTRPERLNHFRSRARQTVLENAASFANGGGGVATLTLPTGMGKTLSGLSGAYAIRDEVGGDRVIYALPFTSIIDQVVDELEEIHETDITGRLLTAHHHLSETTIAEESDLTADEADQNDDVSGMLAEGWRAGVTVTTFVQLFESLAGPTNAQSMKLPALYNSVVILDEPQSLPLDWWKLVPRLVKILTEVYDATVISMTATQPHLFDDETTLIDDPDTYFEATERVVYDLDESAERYLEAQSGPKSYSEARVELLGSIEDGNSALAICNTIDSARTLTDEVTQSRVEAVDVAEVYAAELDTVAKTEEISPVAIADEITDGVDRSILHLSTRIRPVDRLNLIEIAKELTSRGHPLLVVSTQLVEAGVDISFDRVYRDLAPIDSIVQAAGRCNRSFERDQGRVTVWWLDVPGDQQKTPAEAVYNRGTSLLPVTAETLDSVRTEGSVLDETTVARDAVEQYYERLHRDKNVGVEQYASYVDDGRGDKLADLSLIDKRRAVDVIICRTDADRSRLSDIDTAWEEYDFQRVRTLMDDLKSCRISVPVYEEDTREGEALGQLSPVHPETDIRWVDVREGSTYFDSATGFVVPDTTAAHRIL